MEIIPAIDIRGGRCVRLDQGDYARETVFDDDPVEMARRWEEAGATRMHVVDLDGARDGSTPERRGHPPRDSGGVRRACRWEVGYATSTPSSAT